jgi:hypothetical protein
VESSLPSESVSAKLVEVAASPAVAVAPVVQEANAVLKPTERSLVMVSEPASEVTLNAATIAETSSNSRSTVAPGGGMKIDRAVDPSPSTIEIAPKLAAIRASDPAVSPTLLAQNSGFEVRPVTARTAVEPLQQMTPPGESRRLRILTAMVAAASSESSYRTTERAASRIAEERLYDQNQRFGARGAGVQLKF